MNRAPMLVVEEFAAFLQFGKPDELAPEFADWGRFRLSFLLTELSPSEKAELADFLEQERAESTGAYQQWIAGLPEQLGLDEPEGWVPEQPS